MAGCLGGWVMEFKRGGISLPKRLFGFVGIAVAFILLTVGIGVYYYLHIEKVTLLKNAVHETAEKVLVVRAAEKTYLQFYKDELKEQFGQAIGQVDSELSLLLGSSSASGANGEWSEQVETIRGKFERYKKAFYEVSDIHGKRGALADEMEQTLHSAEGLLEGILRDVDKKQAELQMEGEILSPDEFGMLTVVRDCQNTLLRLHSLQEQYLLTGDQSVAKEYENVASGNVQTYLISLEQFSSALHNDKFKKTAGVVRESLAKFLKLSKLSQSLYDSQSQGERVLNDMGSEILSATDSLLEQADQSVARQKKSAVMLISIALSVGVFCFVGLSFVIVRSIIGPITYVIRGLTGSGKQMSDISNRVFMSSKELAEGSSQQAAAIEETSSSLEEMSAMTRRNAENAGQANDLVVEAERIITQSSESMIHLTASMNEISRASEETQKIVKTIDEVAFQTNLLALNAAVEAARAGEVGAGFAVVADEVRALAKRAAEAARNTAVLIEGTVKVIRDGSVLVKKSNSDFFRMADSTSKVATLVKEIAEASKEQAEGINQVNKAMAEVDEVTQRTASEAEASVSAFEEMHACSGELNTYVEELITLVGGDQTKALILTGTDPGKIPLLMDDAGRE